MKKLLYVVLGIIAVVVVCAAIALWTVDFDGRFKTLVAGAVEHATGRKLTINGRVKLSVLPLPALTVRDVALANAPGAADPDMVKLGELSARVYLVPLLLGQGLHIDRLLLKDVTLLLQTDAQGRSNWQFPAPASGAAPAPPSPAEGRFALASIGDVRLENVTLTYRDDRVGRTLTGLVQQLALVQALDGSLGLTAALALQGTPVAVAATLGALGKQPYPIDATIAALGGKATLHGSVADPMAGRGLDLAVALDGDNFGELAAASGAQLPAKPYHLAAKLSGDAGGAIALTGLQSNIGASALTGEMQFAFAGPRPTLFAKLDAKLIDFSEVPPPLAPDRSAASGDDRMFSNDPLPFSALAGIDLDLTLSVAELRGAAMPLRNLAVQATLNDRNLQVTSFAVDLPAGHLGGKAGVLARQAPSIEFSLDAKRLDLGALLAQIAGIDLLAAKGDVAVSVTGRGDSVRAIMATLNGTASVEAGRGVIRSRFADMVGAEVFREGFAWVQGRQDLTLNCVVARFDIRDGIATARGLLLDADLVTVSGSGTINLGSERLALQLVPKPKPTSLLNLAMPLDVGGRLNHPTITPNRAAMAKSLVVGAAGAVNPLFALVPLVLDRGGDSNGCVAALSGKPAGLGGGVGGAVGGAAKQLDQTLKKLLP